jgi:4-amino-4-deoxy-L-arabinose transferase-like glycosyltransferase
MVNELAASATGAIGGLFALILIAVACVVGICLYWAPTLVALWFRHQGKPVEQMNLIAGLNVFAFVILPWWVAWWTLLYKPYKPQPPNVFAVNNPGNGQQSQHEASQWPAQPAASAKPAAREGPETGSPE